ncbi:MAG: NUDIX hydrolase [Acidimicrobiales bacterium]
MSDEFHVVGTKKLLQSRVFGVEQRTVAAGDITFERDVVTHLGAVAILAINDRDEIGMIRQYRTPFDRFCWELPAGTLDVPGEDPLGAAQRELGEELGCVASRWKQLGTFMTSPGWSNQLMTIFEARGLTETSRQPAGPEEAGSTVRWFSRDELRETLRREPAVDNTTVVGLGVVYGTFFDDV